MSKNKTDKLNDGILGKSPATLPALKNYSSRKEWEEAAWHKILESKKILPLLISSHERHDLIMRAAAMEGLASGKGQRQLSRELFISLQTINSVKKAMAENKYKSYSERGKKERRKKKYSSNQTSTRINKGKPVRTKYGIIRMP